MSVGRQWLLQALSWTFSEENYLTDGQYGQVFYDYGFSPPVKLVQLYLGTRYSALFVFIMVVIRMDGPAKLSCQVRLACPRSSGDYC
jgi:hypothetical protein